MTMLRESILSLVGHARRGAALQIVVGTTVLLGALPVANADCPGAVNLVVGYDFDFGAKTGIAPASSGTCVAGATSAPAGDDYCSANTTNATNGDFVIRTADFGTATLKYSFPVGTRHDNYTITVDIPRTGDAGHTAGGTARAAGQDVATWSGLPSHCSGAGSAITNGGRRLICNVGTVDATGGPVVIAVPASFKVSPRAYNGERFALSYTEQSSGGTHGTCAVQPTKTSPALSISARPNIDLKTSVWTYTASTRNGVPGYYLGFYIYVDTATVGTNVGGEPVSNPLTFNVGLTANVPTPGVEFIAVRDYWENNTKLETSVTAGAPAGNGIAIPVRLRPETNATNSQGVAVPCAQEFLVPGGGCLWDANGSPQRLSWQGVEYWVPLSAFGSNSQINFTHYLNSDGSSVATAVLTPPASGVGVFADPIASNSSAYTAVRTLAGTWSKYTDEFTYDNGLVRPPNSVNNNSWVRMPGELTTMNWCLGGECKQYPTRPVESMIHAFNRSEVNWSNTIICDKFDNRGMVLTPAPRKAGYGNHLYPNNMQTNPITGMYAGVTAVNLPDGYFVEVAVAPGTPTGGGYPSNTQRCGDADATWVDAGTVTDFSPYNLVRVRIPTVASPFVTGTHPYIAPVFRFAVPATAPNGAYIGNQVIVRTDTENFGGGIGQWSTGTFNPQTNTGVYIGERFQVVKGLVRVAKRAYNSISGNETSIVGAGKHVTFELAPSYTAGPGVTAPEATIDVVDTLPVQLSYKLGTAHICVGGTTNGGLCTGGTSQPLEPNSVTVNGSGQQVLSWTLPNIALNSAIPKIYFEASAPQTVPLGTVLTNRVTVYAPAVDQSTDAERTATFALTVDSIAGFFTTKKTNIPFIPRDGVYTYTLEVANLKATTETNVDIIDVLPRSGDPRDSNFAGTRFLTGQVTGPSATVYYTKAAAGQAPTALTSTIAGTAGSAVAGDFTIAPNAANGWCTFAEFGTGSCPANLAEVTGVRAILASIPGTTNSPNNVVGLSFPMGTNGNAEGNRYVNRFVLNAVGLAAPLLSNDITTLVKMGQLRGRVYSDSNLDSAFNTGEFGIGGFEVKLCSVDESPCTPANTVATTTTAADGTYTFGDLFPGTYFVRPTYPAGYTPSGANPVGSAGGVSVAEGFDTVTLGVGQIATNYNLGIAPALISGTVVNDPDGATNNLIDGTGTDAGSGSLTVYLVSSDGLIVAASDVAANGTYSLRAPIGTGYTLVLSTNAAGVVGGNAAGLASVPAGWVNTSEADATVNGIRGPFNVVNSAALPGADFGIEQVPVAGATTLVSQQNPGGSLTVAIPAEAFIGVLTPAIGTGTPATDATAVTAIRFTAFPSNADSITINGATYTAGTFPGAGVTVTVAQLAGLAIDPVDGSLAPVLSYVALDAAGATSAASSVSVPLVFTDSDGDGVVDGTDLDDDNDGILDTVEGANTDTDGDGVVDRLDLDSDNDGLLDRSESGQLTGVDANGDGRLDGAVGADGVPNNVQGSPDSGAVNYAVIDTDGDGKPDFRDLDSDNDGINDVREANGADANGDGLADGTINAVGVRSSVPAAGLPGVDTDSDGRVDHRDLDADNDGINDVIENGGADPDNNGIVGTGQVPTDGDSDGIADVADANAAFGDASDAVPANGDNDPTPNFRDLDSDNDSVADVIEGGNGAADTNKDGTVSLAESADTDGDGIVNTLDNAAAVYGDAGNAAVPEQGGADSDTIPDFLDLDSDGDGQTDLVEAGRDPAVLDSNGDGQIDAPVDPDGDGIPNNNGNDRNPGGFAGATPPDDGDRDGDGIANGSDLDDDNDGILDSIEGFSTDTDGDGVPDRFDLDSDNDGILDWRESGATTGVDADGDGRLDGPVGTDGVPDAVQASANSGTVNFTIANTDGDSVGDWRDLDADNDGIADVRESNHVDADGNGRADGTPSVDGVAATVALTDVPTDTDSDGVGDWRDLDADNDSINDVREANGTDANGDGLVDGTFGATGLSSTVPAGGLVPPDTDGDSVGDWRDLDTDNDGINDVIEAGAVDPDNDGIVGTGAVPADADRDGIADVVDGKPTFGDLADAAPANGDNDNVPNFRDLDSDNDSVSDAIEGGNGEADTNRDGTISPSESADSDGDGIPNALDNNANTFGDAGNAALPEQGGADTDVVPDYLDVDSDQDGLTDLEEAGRDADVIDTNHDGRIDSPVDPDGDGIPNNGGNDLNPTAFGGTSAPDTADTDGDGIPNGADMDDDNDGILDTVEGKTTDTDGDGVPDRLDLDADNDGILDWIESGSTGGVDADGDGRIDGAVGPDGVPDVVQTAPDAGTVNYTVLDTDGDGRGDWRDLDSDNDGITDVTEANRTDADHDGKADGTVGASGIPASVVNTASLPNTDGDARPDYRDLDSDNDGINDVREANGLDADGNGLADGAVGGSGIPASVPAGGLTPPDTDGDARPDFRDLDTDNDGINDVIENGGVDSDNDGVVGAGAVPADTDGDGIADAADAAPGYGDAADPLPANGDNDAVPNYRDLDSDNDTVADVIEGGNGALDLNHDGTVQPAESGDSDGDGIADVLDSSPTVFGDAGNATVPEQGGADTDSVPDFLDADSDEDGLTDLEEAGRDFESVDTDGNGQLDDATDPDGDGIPNVGGNDSAPDDFGGSTVPDTGDADGDGITNGSDLDDDNDGIPDAIEGYSVDTDGDGVPDRLDLDADNDGILDIYEAGRGLPVDTNGDGRLDGAVGADGIPDVVQAAGAGDGGQINYTVVDTDADGVRDWRDLDADNDGINDVRESDNVDLDNNGIVDGTTNAQTGVSELVVLMQPPTDTDSDTVGDWRDLDADNDGVNDVVEAGLADDDNNGLVGAGAVPADGDGDGIADVVDAAASYGDATDTAPRNSDNDTTGDWRDLDSDNDTVADVIESGNGALDADSNGTLTVTEGTADTDGDGIVDAVDAQVATFGDAGNAVAQDRDNDGTPDVLDLDSDGDGVPDILEATGSLTIDADSDGRIDTPVDDDSDGVADNMSNDSMPADFGGATPPKTLTDTDGDGLPDALETELGTNPNDADSDDDGVMDGAELRPGTDSDGDGLINALDPDSDNDGLFDGTEMGVTTPHADTDLANGNFVADADPASKTNPLNRDTDNGGVADGNEDTNRNGAVDAGETDPTVAADDVAPVDTDMDGISDAAEAALGSNPNDADSDDDGVVDGNEANPSDDTDGDGLINVLDPDSDADGLKDGTEMGVTLPHADTDTTKGQFVPDADPATTTSPVMADTDRGGVSDGTEDTNGNGKVDAAERNPNDKADDTNMTDSDNDGIVDWVEGGQDTDGDGTPNYLDTDSDNDGITDSREAGDTDLATPPVDTDQDGTPDYVDLDSDADSKPDKDEGTDDVDGDGKPNYIDIDTDNDGVNDGTDNCYVDVNGDQTDSDGDGAGDACDADSDNDGFDDELGVSGGGCATAPGSSGMLWLLAVALVAARRRRKRAA